MKNNRKSHNQSLHAGLAATFLAAASSVSFAQETPTPTTKTLEDTPAGPVVEFTLGEYTHKRTLHDGDEDGWCDLWCAMHPKIEHRNKTTDTDGDGLTDYQEMVLMRDAMVKGPLPRYLSPEEIAEATRRGELKKAEWEAMMRIKHADKLLAGQQAMEKANDSNANSFRPHRALQKKRVGEFAAAMKRKADAQKQAREAMALQIDPRLKAGGVYLHRAEGGKPVFIGNDNVTAADTISADELWPGGSSLLPDVTGNGVTIGIWEAGGGVFEPHVELQSRVTQNDNPVAENRTQYNLHATAVAGTIAAAGVKAQAQGASYQATLEAYAAPDDFSEMATEAAGGLELSNHSYSRVAGWRIYLNNWFWFGPVATAGEDAVFGLYDFESRNLDIIAYEAQTFLSIHSSGNEAADFGPVSSVAGIIAPGQAYLVPEDVNPIDGFFDVSTVTHPSDSGLPLAGSVPYTVDEPNIGPGFDTIKPSSVAKNNLSIGAVNDIVGGVSSPTQPLVASFSSHGPTDDGRIKPDLVANGVEVVSPTFVSAGVTNNYSDDSSAGISGTSFSTPSITGGLGLLHNLNAAEGGNQMLSSTWKALLLNTASDATQAPSYLGTTATAANLVGPDYFYGWGVANMEEAAEILKDNLDTQTQRVHLREYMLFDGNTIEIPIEHDGSSSEIRVCLCWTDPAFQDSTVATVDGGVPVRATAVADDPTSRLINDLDLRVMTPSGGTEMPWVLDPANLFAAATNGDNFRDNVEQIVISTPVAGTYTVKISHKGQLRAADPILPGEPEYDAANPKYRLVSGREQAISLCVTGNKELSSDFLKANAPLVIGNSVFFELQSFVGVRY